MGMSVDLDDVQGNVLRGYGLKFTSARHYFLGVENAAAARAFLGELADGARGDDLMVTRATQWPGNRKPGTCLNVGVTWPGLKALGVADGVLKAFPAAFRAGPAERAKRRPDDGVGLGDVGDSDPEHWIVGRPGTPEVHVVVSLYARRDRLREEVGEKLTAAFADRGLIEACERRDAHALSDDDPGVVHFGYRDGIGQPRIADGLGNRLPDMQPAMPAGDLLLGGGHVNSFGGNYAGALPPALAANATYGAFRILEQDVAAFEELIETWGQAANMSSERIAAKLMGRWRNGVPLTLSPESDQPTPPLPYDKLDEFDYAAVGDHDTYYDDAVGLRCPIGAHVRRLNPRGARVMGKPFSRRLVRRNMPYGPQYDPNAPTEDERGLIGYFLCGDLETQWEFIQRVWVNEDLATSGIRGTREPIGGTQPRGGGTFTIRTADGRDPIVLRGLPNLVTTRGSLYCLLPGIGGLRGLASLAHSNGGNA
jgi:deferrochelatase/peroxidase EfeB